MHKNIFFSLLFCLFFCTHTYARVTFDHTHVSMEGKIIDTPCAIAPTDRNQLISLGSTSINIIARNGADRLVPFTIRLVGCELKHIDGRLPAWQGFSVTFDGVSDGKDFAIRGTAGGVALRITDADGHVALPGVPLPFEQLVRGDQSLNFNLQLVTDHQPLVKGNYHAVIRFGLSYF